MLIVFSRNWRNFLMFLTEKVSALKAYFFLRGVHKYSGDTFSQHTFTKNSSPDFNWLSEFTFFHSGHNKVLDLNIELQTYFPREMALKWYCLICPLGYSHSTLALCYSRLVFYAMICLLGLL